MTVGDARTGKLSVGGDFLVGGAGGAADFLALIRLLSLDFTASGSTNSSSISNQGLGSSAGGGEVGSGGGTGSGRCWIIDSTSVSNFDDRFSWGFVTGGFDGAFLVFGTITGSDRWLFSAGGGNSVSMGIDGAGIMVRGGVTEG